MLLALCPHLSRSPLRVQLASGSPRRQQLMSLLLPGVPFRSVASSFAEDLQHESFQDAADYASETSLQKAMDVWKRNEADVLISADTVVLRDGKIMEKPQSASHAFSMLRSLSCRSHEVVTGVSLLFRPSAAADSDAGSADSAAAPPEPIVERFSVSTRVTFTELSDEQIQAYIDSNEPMDKAGGYGYQSLASTFISHIDGDYYNVVGFPLHELARRLKPHLERMVAALPEEPAESAAPATADN